MPTLNNPSSLLSRDENNLIFSLLGIKCSALATSVVERYEANGRTGHHGWIYSDVGVICFVKDIRLRSYFFRIYCPNRQQLIWEHELYNFMEYQKLNDHLYAFEAEDCIVGFNFANDDEGNYLYNVVNDKLKNRHRITRATSRREYDIVQSSFPSSSQDVPISHVTDQSNIEKRYSFIDFEKEKKKKKNKKKGVKIRKDMIGLPQDFVHLTHYGLDSQPNFNLLKDEHLQALFNEAGITDEDLKDKKTSKFIYQFIEDNGGMEAVKEEVGPITSSISVYSNPPQNNPPPLSYSHLSTYSPPTNIPPPPHMPPPPPPTYPPPPNMPPPLPPITNIPPPPNVPFPSPPPITVSSPTDGPGDPRSALMEAILTRAPLKHVSKTDEAHLAPQGMSTSPYGSRENLLEEIRHGVKLHSISKSELPKPAPRPTGRLASALAAAVAKRASAIYSDSESEESSGDNTDWGE